jgi:hypothetical protein
MGYSTTSLYPMVMAVKAELRDAIVKGAPQ